MIIPISAWRVAQDPIAMIGSLANEIGKDAVTRLIGRGPVDCDLILTVLIEDNGQSESSPEPDHGA